MLLSEILKSDKNIAIHCPTEYEANRVCKIFHEAGRKWHSGNSYLDSTRWHTNKENTLYLPNMNLYTSIDEDFPHERIIPASDFLAANEQPEKVMYSEAEVKALLKTFEEYCEIRISKGMSSSELWFNKNKKNRYATHRKRNKGGIRWSC